jgi:hypothetical protein
VFGNALRWMTSYLSDREHFVRHGSDSSCVVRPPSNTNHRVSAGPTFFIMYTVDLTGIIQAQGFQPHLYADDKQLYSSCRPENV